MQVLVVDDDTIARRVTAHALQQAGYDVTVAEDGCEALDILKRGKHRLVVSDWKMPRMDGIELCHAIRTGGFARYIYFIMLTAQTGTNETLEGLSAGADDFICKPFNPAELILRVNIGRRLISQETRDMTIFALARLAESRDSGTGAHLERVRSYCRVLVQSLRETPKYGPQIDDEYVGLIYQTSPLHDIGKVAIPDHILLKPGRLTEEEFDIMKTHTTHGAETLEAVLSEFPGTPFLEMARDIALGHHERFDGCGYPRGLQGVNIPLSARIMAVADVYDALTSRRVYKEAFTHERAQAIITEECGMRFDPDVVAVFLAEIEHFTAIREQYDHELVQHG